MKKDQIINNAISSKEKFCEGFFSSHGTNSYFMGVNYAVAKVPKF